MEWYGVACRWMGCVCRCGDVMRVIAEQQQQQQEEEGALLSISRLLLRCRSRFISHREIDRSYRLRLHHQYHRHRNQMSTAMLAHVFRRTVSRNAVSMISTRAMSSSTSARSLSRSRSSTLSTHQLTPLSLSLSLSPVRFTKTHEWIREEKDNVYSVGISDYAQNALGELVFVELPFVGAAKKAGESIAAVESVKAASDVYAPVDGEVVKVNEALSGQPDLVNKEPLTSGWLVHLKVRRVLCLSLSRSR